MTSEKAPERIWFNGALISDHMHTATVPFAGGTEYIRADAGQPLSDEAHDELTAVYLAGQASSQAMVAAAYLDAAYTCEHADSLELATEGVIPTRQRILERTPADASAALAERERRAWEAGRDAALDRLRMEEGTTISRRVLSAIAGLKREKPE